jgi:hypothetical protein
MAPKRNGIDTVLIAIDALKADLTKKIDDNQADLTKKIDDNHSDLKKTLYGTEGTGGIVQNVQTLYTLVCGVPNTDLKGIASNVSDLMNDKRNQGIWNKSLSGGQLVTWVVLIIKQFFGMGS